MVVFFFFFGDTVGFFFFFGGCWFIFLACGGGLFLYVAVGFIFVVVVDFHGWLWADFAGCSGCEVGCG